MKLKTFVSFLLLVSVLCIQGQDLYIKSFGNSKGKPVIFLHGGPGYNCAAFEASTAETLSREGFFVIVYDRRGEGRSKDSAARYTFKQTFDDLNDIYKKYGLQSATLIAHSFGGIVATLYAEANPKKINSIILVSAPVSLQTSFKYMVKELRTIYEAKKDSVNLHYVSLLETMDTTSLEYAVYCFGHAMQNGFYRAKNPTPEAKTLYTSLKNDTLIMKYGSQMTRQAPMGFWKNEKYTTIDLTQDIDDLKKKKIKIYALYGKDDGLYPPEQVSSLQNQIGAANLKYFDNCSHNVFIDQQLAFIAAVKEWSK